MKMPRPLFQPIPTLWPAVLSMLWALLALLLMLPTAQAVDRDQSLGLAPGSDPGQNIVFIFDASGSMWAEMEGGHRITVAREVMREVIGDLPDATHAALVAYGHTRRGDCNDIETLIELGPLDKAAFIARVEAINPRGMTPITASVQYALQRLMASERAASVVLISDGLENCGGDPCAAVRDAAAMDIDFRLHVVGFAMGDVDTAELQCMAEAGGGRYVAADNTRELTEALQTVLAPAAPMLAVAARLNGERIPAEVRIQGAGDPAEVTTRAPGEGDGTVAAALTAGSYRLVVRPEGLDWPMAPTRHDVVLTDGETTQVEADFEAGRLELTLTVDAQPSAGAVVIQSEAGQRIELRLAAESMPRAVWLPAGQYGLTARIDEAAIDTRHDALVLTTGSSESRIFDFSPSRLRLGVYSHGVPLEGGMVRIVDAGTGTQLIGSEGPAGWLGTSHGNPRAFAVPPGTYDVWLEGRNVQIDGQWIRGVEVGPNETVERILDLTPGTLSLGLTHNGRPIKGRVRIVDAATETDVLRSFGATMVGEDPRRYEVPAGTYDVEFTGTDLQAAPHWRRGIEVTAGQAVEAIHDFQLGSLRLGITQNGRPIKGTVRIVDAATETDVLRSFGATMVGEDPRRYEVPAGTYDVEFTGTDLQAVPHWRRGIEVAPGQAMEVTHDFQLGSLSLGITRNGQPIAGRVGIVDTATETDLIRSFGASMVGETPRRYEVPAGTYDIRFEVSGADGGNRWLRGVTIQAGERAEHIVDIAAPE